MTQNDNPMSLVEHLHELRKRLMWALLAYALSFVVCYHFAGDIYQFLAAPLKTALSAYTEQPQMIFTALWEVFFSEIKIALYAAFFLGFPFIVSQLWLFIAPGLYTHEKRAFLPFLIASPFLFFLGAALVYYIIFPMAWEFFLSFQNTQPQQEELRIVLQAKVNEYLSFVMALILAFGLSFQLPILLVLLIKINVLSVSQLVSKRRYAIVFIFVIAAILTPPDIISQIGLALPMLLLFECAILIGKLIEKKRNIHA